VAHWDARLGCVVRPPSDDDPPPFSNFGWNLWRAAEAIEDWHEDLRILYVAGTRAQDYLVLSASLSEPFHPDNSWMCALAERFNWRTGVCLDDAIPAEKQPRVRVTMAAPEKATLPRRDRSVEPLEIRSGAIEPIPVRPAGRVVLPVAAVEEYVHRASSERTLFDAPPVPVLVEEQFDAEDGSDRSAWVRPQDRLGPPGEPESMRERLLWTVLDTWDLRQVEGWKPLLEQALRQIEGGKEQRQLQAELEPMLDGLARAELFDSLRAASVCHRNVEYTLEWPVDEPSFTSQRPLLAGVTDCVWQVAQEGWEVLLFTTGRPPSARKKDPWHGRKLSVLACFRAMHELLGDWPKAVILYSFAEGKATRWPGPVLSRMADSLAEFEPAITAFVEQQGTCDVVT
jgi:hypothetical protein